MMQNDEIQKKGGFLQSLSGAISSVAGVLISLYTLFGPALKDPFKIVGCESQICDYNYEIVEKIDISIEPPIETAKLCVQPYMEIRLIRKRYVILFDKLYSQKAYVSEDGKFPLVKLLDDEAFMHNFEDEIRKALGEVGNELEFDYDTIFCITYTAEKGMAKYFELNVTRPQKMDRYSALSKINAKNDPYIIDVENYCKEDLASLIDDIKKYFKIS